MKLMSFLIGLLYLKTMDQLRIIELQAQYEVLSHVEEMFTPKSKHRVARYVDKRMREILKELEIEKNKLKANGSKKEL